MKFWKSLAGMLTVELTGADLEKTLDAITSAQITISHAIRMDPLTCQVRINRKDYNRLPDILHRRGDHLRIVRRIGLFWKMEAVLHRPVLLFSLILLFLLSLWLPTKIFFITVNGNQRVPERVILSAAETCGIRFGSVRKQVRSEKVKNALLTAVPQLQWAGINTSGCTAVISVRERREEQPVEIDTISDIIADRDGFILSTTVTEGTALIKPGDTVIKGQLLVSGYTDCGICIRASRAQGEILAQTNRRLTAIMPSTYDHPVAAQKVKKKISIVVGKKRINLWKDSRISDTGCGRMYEEYYFSLPGGFQLPIAICIDRYCSYELQKNEATQDQAQPQLQRFLENYLLRQMVAGQIIQKKQMLFTDSGIYGLEGSFICREMIGKEQREQNGVINGKRN